MTHNIIHNHKKQLRGQDNEIPLSFPTAAISNSEHNFTSHLYASYGHYNITTDSYSGLGDPHHFLISFSHVLSLFWVSLVCNDWCNHSTKKQAAGFQTEN